jgi:hypothetical protein
MGFEVVISIFFHDAVRKIMFNNYFILNKYLLGIYFLL